MSATKEFLYELEEYVWLIEFAGVSFEGRGRAIKLMRDWLDTRFGNNMAGDISEWFDAAYELIEQDGGLNWATGNHAKRLLNLVGEGN